MLGETAHCGATKSQKTFFGSFFLSFRHVAGPHHRDSLAEQLTCPKSIAAAGWFFPKKVSHMGGLTSKTTVIFPQFDQK